MKKQTRWIWTAKIGPKGQIVIPKEARDAFNLKIGDGLLLFGDLERGIALAKADQYIDLANAIFEAKKGNK
ncbi:MAG: AbrB/MazE/SpoVT family DNA-binding domain-containing protein [Mycoplasmoidaceae bacterium]